MSSSDNPRIGVVGCGGMGQLHARNAGEAGAEVVAGADVAEEPREEFADAFDVKTFEQYEEMYGEMDLDGVSITTPNAFHAPAAIEAFEADINVLVEKPLADSVEAAERIVEAERASDAFGMVGFQSRFTPAGSIFKAQKEQGRFGDITNVEGKTIRRRGIPGIGSWFTSKELSGGGAIIDIGVHKIDFIMYLLDFPEIEEVTAETRSTFGDREEYADPDDWIGKWDTSYETFDVEDSASAFVRTADGTTISLEIAWAANREPSGDTIVRGTEAGAKVGRSTLTIYEAETDGTDHYSDTEIEADDDYDGQQRKVDAFIEGIESGGSLGVSTLEEGLLTQRIMGAIYRSAEQGEAVSLD
jgi:predicted dehydrogenase